MSGVERLAAACLLPSFPGEKAPDWVLRLLERARRDHAFAYNVRDPEQLASLTGRLREAGASSCSRSTRRAAT